MKSVTSQATVAILAAFLVLTVPVAAAGEIDAVVGHLGLGCKNQVVEKFGGPSSDVIVGLGATLQQDLDSGAMTVEDLKKYGASFSWEVSGKGLSGYCNVDGTCKITEFKQW